MKIDLVLAMDEDGHFHAYNFEGRFDLWKLLRDWEEDCAYCSEEGVDIHELKPGSISVATFWNVISKLQQRGKLEKSHIYI